MRLVHARRWLRAHGSRLKARHTVAVPLTLFVLLQVGSRGFAVAQTRPQFRAVVDAVTVDAFAHRNGLPQSGLTREDFSLRDNGVEQRIESISTTDSAHLIVGLDVSGSVEGGTLDQLRDAVRTVVGQLTDDDRFSLFSFSHRLRLVHRASVPRLAALGVLDQLQAGGSTALHDAVVLGTALARADTRPAVFLLFTDGSDTGSWSSAAGALDAVRHGHVVVFTIGAGLAGGRPSPPGTDYIRHPTWLPPLPSDTLRFMQSVADISGGEFLRVDKGASLAETFRSILARYRQRYLITYTPTGSPAPGWHRLDVRLTNRSGTVVAREGYMARTP